MNTNWIAFKKYGSYFRLEDGDLMQNAMLEDGSMENNPNYVEFIDEDMQNVFVTLRDKHLII